MPNGTVSHRPARFTVHDSRSKGFNPSASRRHLVTSLAPQFIDETACRHHLEERLRRGKCPCLHCGATMGYALGSRHAWECGGCQRQIGLRAGTVMARSPLPLRTWFEAIRALMWSPTIGTEELATSDWHQQTDDGARDRATHSRRDDRGQRV